MIGRDPDMCQLILEDPATSRRHLVCRKSAQGYILENLSRTNPITINDIEVTEPQVLTTGDAIRIGGCVFRFEGNGTFEAVDSEDVESEAPSEPVEVEATDESSPDEELVPEMGIDGAVASEPAADAPTDPLVEPDEPNEEERDSIFETNGSPSAQDPDAMLADIDFDVGGSGRWLLKVISGPNNGAEFRMESGNSFVIGNDTASCDIVFHDISVSRQHARLTVSDDEALTIEDLDSRNKTLIDGVETEGTTSLEGNVLVTIGTSTFVVIDREGEHHTIVSPPIATFRETVKDVSTIEATQAAVQTVPQEEEA